MKHSATWLLSTYFRVSVFKLLNIHNAISLGHVSFTRSSLATEVLSNFVLFQQSSRASASLQNTCQRFSEACAGPWAAGSRWPRAVTLNNVSRLWAPLSESTHLQDSVRAPVSPQPHQTRALTLEMFAACLTRVTCCLVTVLIYFSLVTNELKCISIHLWGCALLPPLLASFFILGLFCFLFPSFFSSFLCFSLSSFS